MFDDFPGDINYAVVINHEEQYSIWPIQLDTLKGWKSTQSTGTKKEIVEKLATNEELRARIVPAEMQVDMAKRARALLDKD